MYPVTKKEKFAGYTSYNLDLSEKDSEKGAGNTVPF